MRCAAVVLVLMLATPAAAESLYREETFRPLTSDQRAYRVGDALTVLVFESSSAATSADTNTEKRGSVGIALAIGSKDERANIGVNEDFGGKGRIQRSGKLLAQLTVTVFGEAPNGDLYIMGSQIIDVNDEKQHIQLEGRVRRADISESNTVVSSRIANAKISYIGEGLLGEKQSPGILTRILSWLRIL